MRTAPKPLMRLFPNSKVAIGFSRGPRIWSRWMCSSWCSSGERRHSADRATPSRDQQAARGAAVSAPQQQRTSCSINSNSNSGSNISAIRQRPRAAGELSPHARLRACLSHDCMHKAIHQTCATGHPRKTDARKHMCQLSALQSQPSVCVAAATAAAACFQSQ